jgi:hypothetical protein
MDLPEGLNPGGECPRPDGDVTAEIATQAQAAIPLKEGLTFSYAWANTPQEEYECLIQVTRIELDAIETSVTTPHCFCRASSTAWEASRASSGIAFNDGPVR